MDALVERTDVPADEWDDFRLGCANQEDEQGRDLARQSLLAGGFPETVPGSTTTRLCGSSLTALNDAARAIEAGDGDVSPIVGVEHMSRVPFSEWLPPLSKNGTIEGNCRDHCSTIRHLPGRTGRVRAPLARAGRRRDGERPVRRRDRPVETADGVVDTDETPRPDTTFEKLDDLPTAFRDDEEAIGHCR